MKKARITMTASRSFEETFADFLRNKAAKGLSEKTLATYQQHFSAITKHIDSSAPIDGLIKSHLENMIYRMRDAGLSSNSIRSYTRTLKSFFSWCNEESAPLGCDYYKGHP